MAYTEQSISELLLRYPEFEGVDESLIDVVLGEAERETSALWNEYDRAAGVLALTAHWLVAQGLLRKTQIEQTADGGLVIDGIPVSGPIKARTVGDVRTEFASSSSSSGSGSSGVVTTGLGFESTVYGRRWLELKRRNTGFSTLLIRA